MIFFDKNSEKYKTEFRSTFDYIGNLKKETWPEDWLKYFNDHRIRFSNTIITLKHVIDKNTKILEIGTPHVFTEIFKSVFEFKSYKNTNQDLRLSLQFENDVFNVVLCMEVIEHLKDNEEAGFNDAFRGHGQYNLIKECYRVLKPNGILFFTTPNLNSMFSLRKLLIYEHPFTFWHHVREMSIQDVKKCFENIGFKIEKFDTIYSWYVITEHDKKILEVLSTVGVSSEYREDNIFIIAKK